MTKHRYMKSNFNNGITLVAVLVALTGLLHLDFPFRTELIFLSVIYILGVDVNYLLISRIRKKWFIALFRKYGKINLFLNLNQKEEIRIYNHLCWKCKKTIAFYQSIFWFRFKFLTLVNDYGESISGESSIAFASN